MNRYDETSVTIINAIDDQENFQKNLKEKNR